MRDIPDQTIREWEGFRPIDLDDYANEDVDWYVTGDQDLGVYIDSGNVADIIYPNDWTGSETITFTARDSFRMKLHLLWEKTQEIYRMK